ncbi:MAG TPA: HAD-IIB family hydrolase [Candidatus Nanoperiomorbaceae bacterium]|nr:HAD-IIB family hydrolase [Candidatus Nanoperiomorbaceae bacterium]
MKKVLAFDIDETLNVAKTPMTTEMAETLAECMDYFQVCAISGQKFDQFLRQLVEPMGQAGTPERLANFHLMVAQGTQYYRFDIDKNDWELVYSHPLTDEEVAQMTAALETASKQTGNWHDNPAGEIIENRISLVAFSALGQAATPEDKYAWDPDMEKRKSIVAIAQKLAPQFEFEIGGTTTINVCRPGTNKVFGMTGLMEQLNVTKEDILYFGDMVQPGGNDYPVVQMGIDTIAVKKWQDTLFALRGILGVSK